MDKHLSPRVPELLERYLGPTRRHHGQRKARLFSVCRDRRQATASGLTARYYCDALDAEVEALPNVFSRDRLDGGSRLLLAQAGCLAPVDTLLDLACGNGVLGLSGFKSGLARQVICADESAMAVASARANATRLFPQAGDAFHFHQGDGLTGYDGPQAQLVLCNPPFHLQHTVDDYAGRRLLEQCARHLPPGGHLCLVANRHLEYRSTLIRHFRRVDKLAQDARFCVWLAERG
jgi:16S rRNA G1207 methylase RsmC